MIEDRSEMGECGRSILAGNTFVARAACAFSATELLTFVGRLVDGTEQIVLVSLVAFSVAVIAGRSIAVLGWWS